MTNCTKNPKECKNSVSEIVKTQENWDDGYYGSDDD